MEVRSKYWWQGSLEDGTEIKLIMHSVNELFDRVESAVKELHSYDVFVLQALPLVNISEAAKNWLLEITGESIENNVK